MDSNDRYGGEDSDSGRTGGDARARDALLASTYLAYGYLVSHERKECEVDGMKLKRNDFDIILSLGGNCSAVGQFRCWI